MLKNTFNFGRIDRYVFFGGGEFGGGETITRMLELLNFKNCYVFTAGKFLETKSHTGEIYKDFLNKNHVPWWVSDDINNDSHLQEIMTPTTIGISINSPWIFNKKIIDLFDSKLINEHGMRLPQNRGGGSFTWVILQGGRNYYCAYHLVAEKIDRGAILKIKEYVVPELLPKPIDFANSQKIKHFEMLKEIISGIQEGQDFELIGQPEYLSIYYPKISSFVNGYINWSWHDSEIEKFIRAFSTPFPGARTFIGENEVIIKSSYLESNDGSFHPFQYGLVYRKYEDRLYVAAMGGSIIVDEIYDNKNSEILSKIRAGDRFFTPQKYIDQAMSSRIFFDPNGNIKKR